MKTALKILVAAVVFLSMIALMCWLGPILYALRAQFI